MESDSESDEEGHGNQDHPAVDDREEEDDDEGATLGTIQQQLQTLVQATTQMVGAINQLATVQQAGQVAGAVGNAGAAHANVAVAPTNPTFHRSPLAAVMEQSGYLDYSSKSIKKFYEQATRPLLGRDEKFDVEPEKFQAFMEKLEGRAKDLGCLTPGRIGMVPEDATSPLIGLVNIFADYGARTLEQVAAFERTYLAQQNRNS